MGTAQDQIVHADVCVVGAGIAGINALHVASRYLRRDQRIVLVDRNDRVGGMWVDTYDYVRLHQPHPFFTAGDVRWTIGKPPEHLATKDEVLDHLRHCVDEAKKSVQVTELLGHELVSVEDAGDGVTVSTRVEDGTGVTIKADRLINAVGLSIEVNQPLALSSARVHSVAPESCDLRGGPIAEDDRPVWVVGSGKTGMDALHALVTHYPGREVNLVAGTGTFFIKRDAFYPTGVRRWFSGRRPNWLIGQLADRFDGTNEDEVFTWCRDKFGIHVTPTAGHFFLGLISEAEIETIRSGLAQVLMDHLVDAVDVGDEVRLELKSGDHVVVPPGSWIVNCTSHFDFGGRPPEPPYVEAGGRILNVGTTGMFGFTSFAGYFLTHLMFLDKLTTAPLYSSDGVRLFSASSTAAVAGALTLAQYNLGLVADHVPAKVFQQCGLDFDRWYPVPRRLPGQVRFLATRRRKRPRYERALDRLGERFGIEGGTTVAERAAAR